MALIDYMIVGGSSLLQLTVAGSHETGSKFPAIRYVILLHSTTNTTSDALQHNLDHMNIYCNFVSCTKENVVSESARNIVLDTQHFHEL